MHSLHFTAETTSDGVLERDFVVGEIPGVLWSPASGSDRAPLVLMPHVERRLLIATPLAHATR